MKKTHITISLCTALLLASCGGNSTSTTGEVATIDVETAFQNPQELLLSDLGEKLTYIPLETLEESLVKLGSSSKMVVTDKYIFVGENSMPLSCFDRSTGKFLRHIGSVGQGPGEYSGSASMEVDEVAKRIYFSVKGSRYQCYDFEGNFLSTVTMPDDHFFMGSHHFSDNMAYTYCNIANAATTHRAFAYQLPDGTCTDSLSLDGITPKQTTAIAPLRGTEAFGGMFFMVEYEDGTWSAGNRLNSTFLTTNGKLYHKDLFCDTLFQMKGLHREAPVAAFRMGSFGGYGRYETSDGMEGKYVLPRLLFNGEQIYFTLVNLTYNMNAAVRRIKAGGFRPSCGIYNLRTGEMKIQKENMYFKHPDEAMPKACVYTLSTDGQWVAVYQADKLTEARENIPADQQPEWLKNLKEDDNPVIMMIK